MEPCKVCEKEYMIVNAAHVKTHNGMTMDEYKNYKPPETKFEKMKFKAYPEYSKLDPNDKIKVNFLKSYINRLLPSEFLFVYFGVLNKNDGLEEYICCYCGEGINDMRLYFILKNRDEILRRQVLSEQKGMHQQCALVTAQSHHRVNFMEYMKVQKVSLQ